MGLFRFLHRRRNALEKAGHDAEIEASSMLLSTLQQLIEEKNRTDVILSNLDEGVLLLDENRVIQSEYSPFIETLFATSDIGGVVLEDLVFPQQEKDKRRELQEFLDAVIGSPNAVGDFIDSINPVKRVTVDIVLASGAIKIKTLAFRFARTIAGKDSERLLVVIRDVTDQEASEKVLGEARRKADSQLSLLSCVLRFGVKTVHHFFVEAATSFSELKNLLGETPEGSLLPGEVLDSVLRRVHSVKGNGMALGFDSIADQAHQLETFFSAARRRPLTFALNMEALIATANFKEEVSRHKESLDDVLEKAFGDDETPAAMGEGPWQEGVEALANLAAALEGQVKGPVTEAFRVLEEHLWAGAGGSVDQLSGYLEHHLRQIEGTRHVEWRLNTQLKALPPRVTDDLRDTLIHLIRNSVSHGGEDAAPRLAVGKPPRVQIQLSLIREGLDHLITLADDGKGVSFQTLRELALDRGYPDPGENGVNTPELLRLLLEPGVSTLAGEVTTLSGRGVGLDAVSTMVRSWGGALRVESQPGQGMSVSFRIPGGHP